MKVVHFDGILDLKGNEPIGAALSIGRKDPSRGHPIDKNRFFLVVPKEAPGGPRGGTYRPFHPAFAAFNGTPDRPQKRTMVRGNLIHATVAECFNLHLKAMTLPDKGGMHPQGIPVCRGDGRRAQRWQGDEPDNWATIECPNEKCHYRQKEPWGGKVPCKPFSRLLFMLRWPTGNPLPRMLVKFSTGAWSTTGNLKGLFDHITDGARQLGIENPNLFGYPFTLTLTERVNRAAKTRFPTVSVSPDVDVVTFFRDQAEHIRQIGGTAPKLIGMTAPESAESYRADHELVSATIPSGGE